MLTRAIAGLGAHTGLCVYVCGGGVGGNNGGYEPCPRRWIPQIFQDPGRPGPSNPASVTAVIPLSVLLAMT